MKKESLFELSYGKMEDQIDISQAQEDFSPRKNRILMQNGIFYISNGKSGKIMEFNSYGDILNLYYNGEKNPEPVILTKNKDDEETSTRNVYSYPFNDIGEIGVDTRKMLYIDDRIADNRIEYDEALGVPLNRIILQFDQAGNYIDYLGQEGSGGTPFSYIEKIRITARDELVVFTRNSEGWKVFWFSSVGKPLYIIDIESGFLPFPSDASKESGFASLETIECDQLTRLLYLKIDYYTDYSKVLDSEETGIAFNESRIWWMDVQQGVYSGSADIPSNLQEDGKPDVFNETDIDLLYEFVGSFGDGYFFLLSLEGRNAYNLMILNRNGRVVQRWKIDLGNERLLIKDFYVSHDGILTALLGWEENMEVAWWRTDQFLQKDPD